MTTPQALALADALDTAEISFASMRKAAALLRVQHEAIERKDALLRQALEMLEQHIAKFDSESFTSACELDDAKDLCDTIKEELQ